MEFLYESNKENETELLILAQYFNEFKLAVETVPNTIQLQRRKGKKPLHRDTSLIGKSCTIRESRALAKRCSITKLQVPAEQEQIPEVYLSGLWYLNDTNIRPIDCSLKTVKFLYSRKGKVMSKHPNRIIRNINGPQNTLRPYEHILVCVRVYEPYSSSAKRCKGICFSEIQLLGNHTLADLRDRIVCPKDLEFPGEVSENPLAAQTKKAKEYFRSSFLFIEDVFYNDTRGPDNEDYSVVIRKWAKSQGIEPLSVASMHSMKIEDKCLRFGRPYVFVHMGGCEHLIIFTTARLLHPSDCLTDDKYPISIPLYKRQVRVCMMCQKIAAKWLVKNCDRLVYETTFLCHNCFISFCYIDGKKIGNFKAYVYADRASIMS